MELSISGDALRDGIGRHDRRNGWQVFFDKMVRGPHVVPLRHRLPQGPTRFALSNKGVGLDLRPKN